MSESRSNPHRDAWEHRLRACDFTPHTEEGWNVELDVSVPVVRFGPFKDRAQAEEFKDMMLAMVRHTGKEVYIDKRKAGAAVDNRSLEKITGRR